MMIIDPHYLSYSTDFLNILIIVLYDGSFKPFARFAGNAERRAAQRTRRVGPYEDLAFSLLDGHAYLPYGGRHSRRNGDPRGEGW
jgi:hypothetical protein